MSALPVHLQRVRLALAGAWVAAAGLGSTALLTASHLGAGVLLGPLRKSTIANAQFAGVLAVSALVATLLGVLVLAAIAPALRAAARRVSWLCAALMVTGLPCAMLALALSNWTGGGDYRDWTLGTGLVGFILWVRALTEAWRGALLLLRD